jgi:hypothetical protein
MADTDPRRPENVHQFPRPPPEDELDIFQMASSGSAMSGMWLKNRYLCAIGLFLALMSWARGTNRSFSYQQFFAALAFSVVGLIMADLPQVGPGQGPAPPSPATPASGELETF